MNLQNWMDETFLQSGCFFCDKENKKVIFSKGGVWLKEKPTQSLFFFLRPFYHEEILFLHNAKTYMASIDEVNEQLIGFKKIKIDPIPTENFDKLFFEDFRKFKEHSKNGLKKAVLLSRKVLAINDIDSLKKKAIASSLLNSYGWAYGLWMSETLIIGISPEILGRNIEKKFSTFALAGTSLRSEGNSLASSDKDIIEHNFVVKNIIEDLEPFCEKISIGELHTIPFGNLIHLKTEISGNLKSTDDLWKIITKLTPTAALGGYPRNLAINFLKQTDYYRAFQSRLHGSTFGICEGGNSNSIVMIRNIQANNGEVFFEAGAGIVEQSNEIKELQEINKKIEAIQEMIL